MWIYLFFLFTRIYYCQSKSIMSSMSKVRIFGKELYIKRDDLNIVNGINGNKARKFKFLSSSPFETIVSFGGIQSNSMLAIAKSIVENNLNSRQFLYITKHIPKKLKESPIGNFKTALNYGMKIIEVSRDDYNVIYSNRFQNISANNALSQCLSTILSTQENKYLWIPQGGAMLESSVGVRELANEIYNFISSECILNKQPWKVIFSSGTGTTSYFVNYFIQKLPKIADIEVIAVPCSGDHLDLYEQLQELTFSIGHNTLNFIPTILQPQEIWSFAKPSKNHLEIWNRLQQESGIYTFDVIYTPRAMEILLSNSYKHPNDNRLLSLFQDNNYNIIYYHCGGNEGNQSQLERYKDIK